MRQWIHLKLQDHPGDLSMSMCVWKCIVQGMLFKTLPIIKRRTLLITTDQSVQVIISGQKGVKWQIKGPSSSWSYPASFLCSDQQYIIQELRLKLHCGIASLTSIPWEGFSFIHSWFSRHISLTRALIMMGSNVKLMTTQGVKSALKIL